MADSKLTDLTALTGVAAGDFCYVVDISDTTDDAAGSSRKITRANLITAVANTFTLGQTIAQDAGTGTQISALTVTGAAHTALTASTENVGINLDMSATKQFATGALTTQREVVILGATYAFVGASTLTEATTLYVKEPTAGTNATITRKNAIVSEGTLAIRQPGGTAGTDEVQIYHDGTNAFIEPKQGSLKVIGSASSNLLHVVQPDNDDTEVIARFAANNETVGVEIGYNFIRCNGGDLKLNFIGGRVAVYDGSFDGQLHVLTGSSGRSALTVKGASGQSVNIAAFQVDGGTVNSCVTPGGWFQNTGGEAALESAYTDTDATLGNTNLSLTVIAGRSYRMEGYLIVSNSVAGEGFKMDFDGGTATMTTFDAALSAVGTNTPGTVVSAALATDMNYTSVTGTNRIFVRGYLEVNAGGTFILRASEDTTGGGGTMTLAAGSWIALYDTVDK